MHLLPDDRRQEGVASRANTWQVLSGGGRWGCTSLMCGAAPLQAPHWVRGQAARRQGIRAWGMCVAHGSLTRYQ